LNPDDINRRLQQMQEILEKQRNQQPSASASSSNTTTPAPAPASADIYDLTPSEADTYREALPVINKVVQKALVSFRQTVDSLVEARVQEEVSKIRQDIDAVRGEVGTVKSVTEQQFNSQVQRLGTDRGINVAALPSNPAWVEFMNTPMVTGGSTLFANEMQRAADTRDAAAVAALFDEFVRRYYSDQQQQQQPGQQQIMQPGQQQQQQQIMQPGQQQQPMINNGADGWSTPTAPAGGDGRGNYAGLDTGTPAQKVYKMSDYEKFVSDLNRGQHSMEEYAAFEAEFQKALDEGRVQQG
jgi:hypothetical protein